MKAKNTLSSNNGFTLVELLVAMVISTIILMSVFLIYRYQQQHYLNQLEVTKIQQNIRGAMNLIGRDIRMAGFDDPETPIAQIVNAEPDLFYFTYDNNEDGDVDDSCEHIAYDLYTAPDGKPTLGRTSNNGPITVTIIAGHAEVTNPSHQPAAENIEHLEFFYLDKDGKPTTDKNLVRSVVISMVAKADLPDPEFTNTQTYTPASNLVFYNTDTLSGLSWIKNDHIRRRFLTTRIDCRNMGI